MEGMEAISDPRDDDDLIVATAGGDADAFAAFYSRRIGLVLAVLRRQTGVFGARCRLGRRGICGSVAGLPSLSSRRPTRNGVVVRDR